MRPPTNGLLPQGFPTCDVTAVSKRLLAYNLLLRTGYPPLPALRERFSSYNLIDLIQPDCPL
jgi:hypothetical protein